MAFLAFQFFAQIFIVQPRSEASSSALWPDPTPTEQGIRLMRRPDLTR